MFCPKCGAEIKSELIKWESQHKYSPPEAHIWCPKCGEELYLEDRSATDQENYTEVIFH